MPNLQCEEPIVDLHLLGQEIRADRRLILVAELVVHVPAQEPPKSFKAEKPPPKKKTVTAIKFDESDKGEIAVWLTGSSVTSSRHWQQTIAQKGSENSEKTTI